MTVATAIGGLSPFLPAREREAASERTRQRRSLAPVEAEVVQAQVVEPQRRDVVSVRVEVVASERKPTDPQFDAQHSGQRDPSAPLPAFDSEAALALMAETPPVAGAVLGLRAFATSQRAAAAYNAQQRLEYAPPSLPARGPTLNLRA